MPFIIFFINKYNNDDDELKPKITAVGIKYHCTITMRFLSVIYVNDRLRDVLAVYLGIEIKYLCTYQYIDKVFMYRNVVIVQ